MTMLSLHKIQAHLEGHPWQGQIRLFRTVDSTNTQAKALAAAGAPAGTVLLAEGQTAGRGRMGRGFLSPSGQGIYLSVILRPLCFPQELMHLTCAAAEVLCDAVEGATGLRPGIKWTNDLVFGSRKLAGILTELSLGPDGRVRYAVVGVGINCTQTQADFPPELREIAGSLSMFAESPVDRNRLAAEMILALSRVNDTMMEDRLSLMEGYRRDCVTLGKPVAVHRGREVFPGTALDIDDWGGLVVDLGHGLETVQSGEVSVRGIYGYV